MSSDRLVLCYHAISPDWPAALSVTPPRFEAQLRFLVKRGYKGVRFQDAVAAPPGDRLFAVTFDDAYRSVIDRALPILEPLGIPATVFVPTRYPDQNAPMAWPGIDEWLGGPHEHELACMSWDELRVLAGKGWEIGSHSDSHPRLPEIDDDALAHELIHSRAVVEDMLSGPCPSIAYPYGAVDERVAAASASAGYSYGAALVPWVPELTPLRWPRIGIYHEDAGWRWWAKLAPSARRITSAGPLRVAISRRRTRVETRRRSVADAQGDGRRTADRGDHRSH